MTIFVNESLYLDTDGLYPDGPAPLIGPPAEMTITVDTTISGATASDTFEFPLLITIGSLFVDWGDGNDDTFTSSTTATHTYAAGGVKTIIISGLGGFEGSPIIFANGSDKLKITDIGAWGFKLIWDHGVEALRGCNNMDVSATDRIIMKGDMEAFLRQTNIDNFLLLAVSDTSEVTNLDSFIRATDLSGAINLRQWDVSKNTSLFSLFFNTDFTTINIEGWDTRLNTDMRQFGRTILTLVDIIGLEGINVEAVIDMLSMFTGTTLPTARIDAIYDILTGWPSQAMKSGYVASFGLGTYSKGQVDSGTTDGTAANKLIESGQNFLTTVSVGDIVKNTTDTTFAEVTAVDSDTQLSIENDIMISGETFEVHGSNAAKGRYKMSNDFSITVTDGGAV